MSEFADNFISAISDAEKDQKSASVKVAMPEDRHERALLMSRLQKFVAVRKLVPPLALEELREYADFFVNTRKEYQQYQDLITVLISNLVWENTISAIPYERRVLLLPQCLRSSKKCKAEMDEFGLLCAECGACMIGDLQAEAEALGYIVLVAEGTTVVTRLLESGTVDAVIGVSCLSSLKKMFSRMAEDAIPGIAIPLIFDGCVDTKVDSSWLKQAIRLSSDSGQWLGYTEINELHEEVNSWFQLNSLQQVFPEKNTTTRNIGISWLTKGGKRWRPFLVAAVFKALRGMDASMPQMLKLVAIAVECFHKASLIHDDIEDGDTCRYGEPSLYCEHGVPIAINTGDLLLGEGYRLLAGCDGDPLMLTRMIRVAAAAHHCLCVGQGEELLGLKQTEPLTQDKVIEIFQYKTSPAFAVALELGAICAEAEDDMYPVLRVFSDHLGIAYQIQDDICDFHAAADGVAGSDIRVSVILALAMEVADKSARALILSAWRDCNFSPEIFKLISSFNVEKKAVQLCEYHKHEAVRSLAPLRNSTLKSLLRKIIRKIIDKA